MPDVRAEEGRIIAQAERLGAHIASAGPYRTSDGALRIRDGGAVEDWLDGLAQGLDSRRS